jgi:DNA-binding CsgD family transcriptional regulator
MIDMPYLLVRGVEPAVWSYQLKVGTHKIGRSPQCEVRIMEPSISRLHAEIRRDASSFYIRDLNSQNGTYVNDQRVHDSKFAIGDCLRVGTVSLDVVQRLEGDSCHGVDDSTAHHDLAKLGSAFSQMCLKYELSQAQRPVLRLLLQGLTEKEVAARLFLSRHTVHAHAKNIYRLVGVHSRPELLARYLTPKTP